MKNISINQVVKTLLEFGEQGNNITLFGIGPMSYRLIEASLEIGKEKDFPPLFIASRNQIDATELGGGYVNDWNQEEFVNAIKEISTKIDFTGEYYICRDHGGPWQRDNERNSHLEEQEAMRLGQLSYKHDMENGFDLLHIDPTKDPYEMGKVIPLEKVLERTVDLIDFCENERKRLNIAEIAYEVGTEETNGGLTSAETYENFISTLKEQLEERHLPMPTFIVGQTGTLVKKTENVGTFNYQNAFDLSQVACKYGVGLKEHNGDYMEDKTMLMHSPSRITATNVAPQFGTEETRAYLELAELEQDLKKEGLLKSTSSTKEKLLIQAIRSERWRKWMVGDQKNLTVDEVLADKELSNEILDIAGHYTFNYPEVKKEINTLFSNLEQHNIDGNRFVINRIKRSLSMYVEGFNLEGSMTQIKNHINNKVVQI